MSFLLIIMYILYHPEFVSEFLEKPVEYISDRLKIIHSESGIKFSKVVILTTYGDRVGKALTINGYKEKIIDIPAGPDNTCFYTYNISNNSDFTYYLEVVNEMDEKIHPSFVFTLTKVNGELVAGMSGSIWDSNGDKNAYIATVVSAPDAPPGAGSFVTKEVLSYLKKQNVKRINLGTQTADAFYKKHGFIVIHTIIEKLRYRMLGNDSVISHDLVIMQKDL